VTGAIASFSLMAVAGREVSVDLDTFELMMYRSLIGAVIVTVFGAATGRLPQMRTGRLRLHVVRNVFHFTGQNLWFYGVAVIPLAQLFAFEFTTPLWVALLAPLVLGEALTRKRALALLLGFLGILIVARPGISPLGLGHLAAAAAAVGFAGNVLATKRLSRNETVWTILFWMTWMQVLFGLVCAGFDGDIALPQMASVKWVLIVGLCGLTAHLSITSALHCAPASVVAPMDFARLPIIAVVGMVLYSEALEVAVFVGAALILAGNLMNTRAGRRR
jgi:drug/metabolite transporter (DMT)-like permease